MLAIFQYIASNPSMPAAVIAIIAILVMIADKVKPRTLPKKSDRELLSADEQVFRTDLMARVSALERELVECERGRADLLDKFNRLIERIRIAGLHLLDVNPKPPQGV